MKSSAGLRHTMKMVPRRPDTAEPQQTVRLEKISASSAIPAKYHIIQAFPVLPKEYQNKGYKTYYEDGEWKVVLWPTSAINSKEDIKYLHKAIDKMLDGIPRDDDNIQNIISRAEIYEIGLKELNRQISIENSERGSLMEYLLDKYMELFSFIPEFYNKIISKLKRESKIAKETLEKYKEESNSKLVGLQEEVKKQQVLLDIDQEWKTELMDKCQSMEQKISHFGKDLEVELAKQKTIYEDKIQEIELRLEATEAERDSYKSQIDWEQESATAENIKYRELQHEMEVMKSQLDEREQILYTTRSHFERQLAFMRSELSQQKDDGNFFPEVTDIQDPLSISEVNQRIERIYRSKISHDAAYSKGQEPSLSTFVIKFHIDLTRSFSLAGKSYDQFISSCENFRHTSPNINLFMQQLSNQTKWLSVIQFMAMCTRNEQLDDNGLPRLTVGRCVELSRRILSDENAKKLESYLQKKIIDHSKGSFVDYGCFLTQLLGIASDVNQNARERVMFQYNEVIAAHNDKVDYPAFAEFVKRFLPQREKEKIADMYVTAMKVGRPSLFVTFDAVQYLVDNEHFDQEMVMANDEFNVSNPHAVLAFAINRWKGDLENIVEKTLKELDNYKIPECQIIKRKLSEIENWIQRELVPDESGSALSVINQTSLLLIRFRFLKLMVHNSENAMKEARKILDVLWS